jgi:arylsulfatase A-like enzyme
MSASTDTRKPNFLFLITDQHRADWLGCAGHPVLKTPHIDALAALGTRFEEFYVASPVCMPNRASLMTGRYPSVHGLRSNGCTLPTRANTFVDVLRAGGYTTASIGKSHLQPFTSDPPRLKKTVETGPITEAWKPEPDDYTLEQPENYTTDERYDFAVPYYGFEYIDMVTSHGDRAGGHYHQWFREKAPEYQTSWQALHDPANELPHSYTVSQAYRTPIPEDLYPTAYIRDSACQYLAQQADEDKPFFAFVSFPDPHHPFNPPGVYWDKYQPEQFSIDRPWSSHKNPTPPMRYCNDEFQAGNPPPSPQTAFVTGDKEVREAMALTAGMIAMVDDAIGSIVQSLKDSGQFDNTVIVFTSDHGDYMGDYNMMLKGAASMRGINRVPFIWRDPADKGVNVTHSLASTLDIAPSILARADINPYYGLQGVDIAPAIREDAPLRESLMIEYQDGFARLGFESPARVRTLLHDGWRLSVYKGQDWGELYNLNNDPHESHNLWDEPSSAGTKAIMMEMLTDQLIAAMDESPRPTRLA